jgi:hypothetical protein
VVIYVTRLLREMFKDAAQMVTKQQVRYLIY